jgi:hypothetical protein
MFPEGQTMQWPEEKGQTIICKTLYWKLNNDKDVYVLENEQDEHH